MGMKSVSGHLKWVSSVQVVLLSSATPETCCMTGSGQKKIPDNDRLGIPTETQPREACIAGKITHHHVYFFLIPVSSVPWWGFRASACTARWPAAAPPSGMSPTPSSSSCHASRRSLVAVAFTRTFTIVVTSSTMPSRFKCSINDQSDSKHSCPTSSSSIAASVNCSFHQGENLPHKEQDNVPDNHEQFTMKPFERALFLFHNSSSIKEEIFVFYRKRGSASYIVREVQSVSILANFWKKEVGTLEIGCDLDYSDNEAIIARAKPLLL